MPVSPGHIVHHRRRHSHHRGHLVSKATRAKISAALRKRGHLVHHVSQATRDKISAGVKAANARKKKKP